MDYIVKDFTLVSEAEVDVFLELSWFFSDQMGVGNLISGSSAFSKSSLNIWKSRFMYCWSLAWRLEHYFASMWNECAVVWTLFGTDLLWDWNENSVSFLVLWPQLSFPLQWHSECSTLTASSFKIWNSSAGIPSPPLVLLVVMLPKAHLTSHPKMSALSECSHHHGYLGH